MTPERRPWLLPREHGAYAQLGCPLVAALLSGRPSGAAALLATATVAAFVAHEPLLVLLGHRGARLRRESRPWRWLAASGGLALAAGLVGLVLAEPTVRWATLAPAVLGGVSFAVLLRGSERSSLGETLAAAALASAAVPVAMACGVAPLRAASAWIVWAAGLAACTAAVRWLIARHKGRPEPSSFVILVSVTALVISGTVTVDAGLAAVLPLFAAAWTLVVVKPHPRDLRTVGWSLVASSLASLGLLVRVAHLAG
ncbi:MAG: YwiC-like family protein [Deltaproteobacteria bacterium]|nr:YwiC-like family protein [Deltaproteobacteria bacterium]